MKYSTKLRALFRRAQIEADMTEEMRRHVELQTEMNLAAGMKPEDARFAALRKFGNVVSIQEECREQRGWIWLEQAMQDLGYAVRQLLKAPGFSATVILTLGLGIGACTVVFTAINSTLLHPLAGQVVDREVIIHETQPPQRPQMPLSPPMFVDLQKQSQSFELITAWTGISSTVRTDTEPMQVRGAAISAGLAEGWSPVPALGRIFTAEEMAKGEHVVMLGYALWQRAFGGSPNVINRVICTEDGDFTVVGVIAPNFARYGSDIEFWVPLTLDQQQREQQRGAHYLQVGAKLKRGVSLEQASAELDVIAANLARQYPDTNKGVGLLVRDIGAYINRSLAPMLKILLGAVGCVLLIACANVANLLLARATVRQREVSIRSALGASRGRLIRQLLAESVFLATLGGALGLLLAELGLGFIHIYGPSAGTDMARLANIELDPAVLAFTLGFSMLTGVVFGFAPAWLGSRTELSETLKQGSRGNSEGGMRGGLRRMLVVLEVALALVLLAGAGLLLKSFDRLARVDPGFSPDRVATMQILLNGRKYAKTEQRQQFTAGLLERIRALPGVVAAGVSSTTPFNNAGPFAFAIAGRPPSAQPPAAIPYTVTADYFKAMDIQVRRGRLLDDRDGVSGPPVFVVNEALVRQYFPNENPLGQSLILTFGRNPGLTGEIVGVIADVMQGNPGEPPQPQFYLPWPVLPNGLNVMVRTTGDPSSILSLLKSQVYALDPNQPVAVARPIQGLMDDKLARPHFMLVLLGIYGLIALVIAAVGIYAVMAYSVSQRVREIGIRVALGATTDKIVGLFVRQGMRLVAVGLALGSIGALIAATTLSKLIVGARAFEPLMLVAVALLLGGAAFLACWLPARRAAKVDPVVALRAE